MTIKTTNIKISKCILKNAIIMQMLNPVLIHSQLGHIKTNFENEAHYQDVIGHAPHKLINKLFKENEWEYVCS